MAMEILRMITRATNPMLRQIQALPMFDIQVAADIQQGQALRAPNKQIVVDDQAGAIKSPYPDIWMEWSRGDYHVGCTLSQRDPKVVNDVLDRCNADQLLTFLFVGNPTNGQVAQTDYRVAVQFSENGSFGGWAIVGEPLTDDLSLMTQTWLGIVMTALALMNCRNVTIEPSGQVRMRRSGADKRRGRNPRWLRYSTIVLPGHQGSSTAADGDHRDLAIHRVRGHFKTFTADRPLLGQHVGTYWWGWQVRGNNKNRVVVSDYQLQESRS